MVDVFDKDGNDNKDLFFYLNREEKEYRTFDCISDVSWLCFVKKETLRLRRTHKDTIYILSKERI